MPSNVRKVPSYLKGLAETRARADGDIARLTQRKLELDALLLEAQTTRDACDQLIKKFDARLDPALIAPIKAWKGRFGERGALRTGLIEELQRHAPQELNTSELGFAMQVRFRLDFDSEEAAQRWQHDSLARGLKRLVAEGLVERLHEADARVAIGRWRWKADCAPSIAALQANAEASGVAVQESDTVDG